MPLVRIEKGEGKGATFVIEERGRIGRDPQADVSILDEKASRIHAQVVCRDGRFFLEDLDSKNGTSLNGRKIQERHPLEPGDHFRIGLTWLSFGADLLRQRLDGILSDYRIEETISEGAVGELYRVLQVPLKRMVALKLLPPNIVRGHPEIRVRFLEELKTLASLNHENIPTVLDFGADKSLFYFTMEWIDEAIPLSDYLAPEEPLAVLESLGIALSCARALRHAHRRGVVHGDVKPENILVTPWRVVLMHFGLSRMLGEVVEETGAESITGTVEYLSPEQLRGRKGDERSDLYSLGVVLYEMLAGHLPFQEKNPYDTIRKVLEVPPRPLASVRPDVLPQVSMIVARCLEKDPENRYDSVERIARDLAKAHDHYKVLELQSEGHKVLFSLKNEFYVLLGWPVFRWVLFPLVSILFLVLCRMLFFG